MSWPSHQTANSILWSKECLIFLKGPGASSMSKNIQLQQCPRCGSHVEQLLPIETGMKVALQAAGQAADLPASVCDRCYEQLTGMVSQGVRLRLEEEARQKTK
jgi:hypothetical protein